MSLNLVKKVDFPSEIFVFALFGVYSFSLAPSLSDFLRYGEKNYFVAVLGFLIYIFEAVAFDFKLRMVRFRSEEKKIGVQKAEGERHLIPRAGPMLWVGLFFRMVFRVGVFAISISALGFPISGVGHETTNIGFFTTVASFVTEGILFFYASIRTNLFNQSPTTREEFNLEWEQDLEWFETQQKLNSESNMSLKELGVDIILHIYAFMLYTAWWDYVNNEGINMVHKNFEHGIGAVAGFIAPLPMLFCMTLLAMMPLRLAYWIEDSAMSFTAMDRKKTRTSFFIAALITISPVIVELCRLYFPK